jgi:hypothetical protein
MMVDDGDRTSYMIEQLDGREVIEVHSLELKDRGLLVRYEVRNTKMSDAEANVLIIVKILRELLLDRYRGQANRIEFSSARGGNATLPYL